MNAIRVVLAIAWKELLILWKDRGALAVLFLLPLLFSSLIGSMNASMARSAAQSATGSSQSAPTVEIFLVNQDIGLYGTQVMQVLKGIDFLRVSEVTSVEEADRQVAEGKTKKLAAVVIPPDFSQKIDAYEQTAVRVIVDPTKQDYTSIITGIMNNVVAEIALQGEIGYGIREVMARSNLFDQADAQTRRMIEGQTLGAIMTQVQAMQRQPVIAVTSEDMAGAEEKKEWNAFSWEVPAFTVMFAFFLIGVVAGTFWSEKEEGQLRRLLSAPIGRWTIIAGKMLGYMVVVFLQVILLFGIGNLAFGMPLGKSPLGLVVVTLVLALVSTSLGMLIAALSCSAKQADGLGTMLGFVLGALGGCIFPFFTGNYGGTLRTISQFTPHAHALQGYLKLIENNATLVQVLPQVGILALFAVVFFGISAWRLRLD
jgi:ABC-2 type transport system permease protein